MCVLSVRFKRIDGIKMLRFISVELYGAVRVEKTISALYKRISATGERGGGWLPPFISIVYFFAPCFFSFQLSVQGLIQQSN